MQAGGCGFESRRGPLMRLEDVQEYVRKLGTLPVPDRGPLHPTSVIIAAERWFASIRNGTEEYRKRLEELGRIT